MSLIITQNDILFSNITQTGVHYQHDQVQTILKLHKQHHLSMLLMLIGTAHN